MADYYGLIPARGGSKGLPGKNTRPLYGKPLIAHTIDAAIQSGVCRETIVSSDDDKTLSIADKPGVVAHRRSLEIACDDTPMAPVVADVIRRRELKINDCIILLQPTSPLRSSHHIRAATKFYQENSCDLLVSVYPLPNKYLKAYLQQGQYLFPLYGETTAYARRQDLPPLFMPNGAIYIFSVAAFENAGAIPNTNVLPFVMSEEDSIDIDTESDLSRCSKLMQERLS
jgi:N-acylneuraminate cytidylyltransferase